MVDSISSMIRTRWYAYEQPISPGVFEVYSRVKKKQSGKSEKLLCLIGVDRTRRGLAGLKYIFLTVEGTRVRRHALEGEFLM